MITLAKKTEILIINTVLSVSSVIQALTKRTVSSAISVLIE